MGMLGKTYDPTGIPADAMTDADPEAYSEGDQLAGMYSPAAMKRMLMIGMHPPTATKQFRNSGRMIGDARDFGRVRLPSSPAMRLTQEDWTAHPELYGIDWLRINGMNRTNLSKEFDVPLLIHDVEDEPGWFGLGDRNRHINLAKEQMKFEEPAEVNYLHKDEASHGELEEHSKRLAENIKERYPREGGEQMPKIMTDLLGTDRSYVRHPDIGGWLQEVQDPSGTRAMPWNVWHDLAKDFSLAHPNNSNFTHSDVLNWASDHHSDPAKQWVAQNSQEMLGPVWSNAFGGDDRMLVQRFNSSSATNAENTLSNRAINPVARMDRKFEELMPQERTLSEHYGIQQIPLVGPKPPKGKIILPPYLD